MLLNISYIEAVNLLTVTAQCCLASVLDFTRTQALNMISFDGNVC